MQAPRSHASACLSRAIQIIPHFPSLQRASFDTITITHFRAFRTLLTKSPLLIVRTRRFRLETVLTQCSLIALPAPSMQTKATAI